MCIIDSHSRELVSTLALSTLVTRLRRPRAASNATLAMRTISLLWCGRGG